MKHLKAFEARKKPISQELREKSITLEEIVYDFEDTEEFVKLHKELGMVCAKFYVHLQDHLMMNGYQIMEEDGAINLGLDDQTDPRGYQNYEDLFNDFWRKVVQSVEDLDLNSVEHLGKDIKKYNL